MWRPRAGPTFWIGMGFWWIVVGPNSKNGPPECLFFCSQFVPPFWVEKQECVKLRKTFTTNNESTKKCMLFKHVFTRFSFLPQEKCTLQKCFFSQNHFETFFLPFSARSKTMRKGAILVFWWSQHGSQGPFEDQWWPFWDERCCLSLWCCLCLWRVPCSVKCVFMTCFALCLWAIRCEVSGSLFCATWKNRFQHRCASLQALPLVQRRQVLILHL